LPGQKPVGGDSVHYIVRCQNRTSHSRTEAGVPHPK
jgi:hypothetical protein